LKRLLLDGRLVLPGGETSPVAFLARGVLRCHGESVAEFDPVLMLIPLVGALIGWCTNWLAIKMLFHPRRPRGWGPFKVQGVIPARRGAMSTSVATTIQRELINEEDLAQTLETLNIKEIACQQAEDLVAEKLASPTLQELGPLRVIHGGLVRSIQRSVSKEVASAVDRFQEQMMTDFKDKLELKDLIEGKIAAFSDDRIEELVFEVARRELGLIVKLGFVLGFFIGCIQLVFIVGVTG